MSDALVTRDYVMARLAGARAHLQAALEATDEALALFVAPDEDTRGKERLELIEAATEAAGYASRGLEDAAEEAPDADMKAGEPYEEEDEDEEDDDDEDEKPAPKRRRPR